MRKNYNKMSNWDKLLPAYGIAYNGETGDKIQLAAAQLHIVWKYDGKSPYTFSYNELDNKYTLQPQQICALVAAARLSQLDDRYVSDAALAEEAKCVLDAYYELVSEQIKENQSLGSLWLANNRQELLAPYSITLEPETRAVLTDAEHALAESLDYSKIYRDLRQKYTAIPSQDFAVLIAAARLSLLDKRFLLDGCFFYEAKAVLEALLGYTRRCLQESSAKQKENKMAYEIRDSLLSEYGIAYSGRVHKIYNYIIHHFNLDDSPEGPRYTGIVETVQRRYPDLTYDQACVLVAFCRLRLMNYAYIDGENSVYHEEGRYLLRALVEFVRQSSAMKQGGE